MQLFFMYRLLLSPPNWTALASELCEKIDYRHQIKNIPKEGLTGRPACIIVLSS